MYSLITRVNNATRHRMRLVNHKVRDDDAFFEILGSRGFIYKIHMARTGMHCSCPDFKHHQPEPCKHILYIVMRFFRISKNDLADLLSLRDIDWLFIQAHLQTTGAATTSADEICPVCCDGFQTHEMQYRAHMCQTCSKLMHEACQSDYQRHHHGFGHAPCPFCRQ